MCGCRNQVPTPQPVQKTVSVNLNENCTVTLELLSNIYTKLGCLESKIDQRQLNKYIGRILSLMNTKKYCDYDISEIITDLNNHGCN